VVKIILYNISAVQEKISSFMGEKTRVGLLKAKVFMENANISKKCANIFSVVCCKALESDGL
jgi:hypothetical protein